MRAGVRASGPGGKRVVVVGGGWAGFGACRHLAREGFDVTLLDAQPNPGGLSAGSGAASADRTMEAGMKGFWYQYHNIFRLANELDLEEPFTDWTESSFYSPSGLVTEGPVFQSKPRLPALLGQAVHTFPLFRNMPLEDRLSMLPLFYAIIDHANDRETFAEYDERTARELFREFGVSERLYREFLRPLLLVGLFAPPEELSAAAVLSCLYFYAIAHQPDFDMRWCRGTVTETFFTPLVERIREDGGEVLGGQRMTELLVDAAGAVRGVKAVGGGGGNRVRGRRGRFRGWHYRHAEHYSGLQPALRARGVPPNHAPERHRLHRRQALARPPRGGETPRQRARQLLRRCR